MSDPWIRKDCSYIWHPYTQMKDSRKMPPILIDKARGMKLYGGDGRFYYDTIASWWCNVHGHNHPAIKKAIKEQLDSLEHVLFAGFTHKPAIRLAEKLVTITPKNLTKVFFSDNGSTAVEVALKMSFQYWRNTGAAKKQLFVCLDHGYHGDTIGAMSVSGIGLFNEAFAPLFFPAMRVPSPYCYRCPMGRPRGSCNLECVRPLEKLLQERGKEIAALIIEPLVMAAGGMIIYPAEYLARVRELTGKYNVHLIADEVATGFGRTGTMFACEQANVRPDFICLSKGITSGYLPLGITLTTDKVFDAFYADYDKKKTFYHGHTYTANPLACAAANACLDIFQENSTLKAIQPLIMLLREEIEDMRSLDHVGDVRSLGMIGAIELVKDKRRKTMFPLEERIGLSVYKNGLKRNLLLRPLGNIVYFFLPLCVTRKELSLILERARDVLRETLA